MIFGFNPKPAGAKDKGQLGHRADSNDTIWFIALAEEQLTLITENRFHGVPFISNVNAPFQGLAYLHEGPGGIFGLLYFSKAPDAMLSMTTMDHEDKNHVKYGLNECKGIVVHRTSGG